MKIKNILLALIFLAFAGLSLGCEHYGGSYGGHGGYYHGYRAHSQEYESHLGVIITGITITGAFTATAFSMTQWL